MVTPWGIGMMPFGQAMPALPLGTARSETSARLRLAQEHLLRGELARAEHDAHTVLAVSVELGWRSEALCSLELMAVVAWRRGRHDRARRLAVGTDAARAELGLGRTPYEERRWRAQLQGLAAEVRPGAAEMDEPMPLTVLAEYARRGRGKRCRPSTGPTSLTPMQLSVARLASDGLGNTEIGRRLFITPATVKSHLSQAFVKLGVRNRTEMTACLAPVAPASGRPRLPSASFRWACLSLVERDMARLAADGLTNPEIAERLFVTRATVKKHLRNIYLKFGVANRTELTSHLRHRVAA